ncbi:MAG: signal peptidase I [bacterium]|nr:signal peptidase I [bacterium]
MKQHLQKTYTMVSITILLFASTIASLTVINKISPQFPIRLLSVISGSMEPVIPIGSAVLVIKQSKYNDNDIITYKLGKILVTHRIVFAKKYFLTKGDANNTIDPETVSNEQIAGRVVLHIPYLGYIQEGAKNTKGLILFVLLPSVLIILHEIIVIIKQIKKINQKPN